MQPVWGVEASVDGSDHLLLCLTEHSGPVVCSDCNPDVDSHSKEQACCPQPVSRDSTQSGTPSSQEPSHSDQEHSPHLPGGTLDRPHTNCRESLYPSNHDRMLTSLKKNSGAPPDGKGKCLFSSQESSASGMGTETARLEGLTCPLLSC